METREIYWNVQGIWIMYALLVVVVGVFALGLYRQMRLLAVGKPGDRLDNVPARLRRLALHILAQPRLLRDRYSGGMHLLFFWGLIVLFLGTVVVFLEADLGIPIMRGAFYLYFQSLALDLFGLLAIVGALMAIFKRYVLRPDRLSSPPRLRDLCGDGVILGLFLLILATGFVLEGARIAATADPWADWSPVGKMAGLALVGLGFDGASLRLLHGLTWWFHLAIAFAFIAYVPFSKLRHLISSPANVFLQPLGPRGALKPMDLETAETLGTPKFEDFPRKRLLDLVACTECGRCQEVCPAYKAGQPLSPKAVIMDLRNELHGRGRNGRSPRRHEGTKGHEGLVGFVSSCLRGLDSPRNGKEAPAVEAATAEALWACVTCGRCMEQCPVFVEHVPTIVDLRRYLVMERAECPDLMQEALASLEARGHPFRGTRYSRTDWCEGLGVKIVAESGPAEWLYWVGCAAALDERNQRVAKALATVLQRAGVDFAILGDEESCTGDVARRLGNEYLYQTMARQNVEILNGYGVAKIVTACPHCLNTLKHEYPEFGGRFQVYHHTELLAQLAREGRLRPGRAALESLVFHDSCYLARYNGIVDPPRDVLRGLAGIQPIDVADSREHTFCCGGGSGHLWYEEVQGRRINHLRADQLLATGAPAIGTSCPFCAIMLSDGLTARRGDREVKVLDVAEVVEMATRPAEV